MAFLGRNLLEVGSEGKNNYFNFKDMLAYGFIFKFIFITIYGYLYYTLQYINPSKEARWVPNARGLFQFPKILK